MRKHDKIDAYQRRNNDNDNGVVIHPAIGTGPEYLFIVDFSNKRAVRTGPDGGVNYSKKCAYSCLGTVTAVPRNSILPNIRGTYPSINRSVGIRKIN